MQDIKRETRIIYEVIYTPDKYYFKNFKCFRGEQCIEIAPIMVLVGPNSGGKSSILQAITILHSVFEYNNTIAIARDTLEYYQDDIERWETFKKSFKEEIGLFDEIINFDAKNHEVFIKLEGKLETIIREETADYETISDIDICTAIKIPGTEVLTVKKHYDNRIEIEAPISKTKEGGPNYDKPKIKIGNQEYEFSSIFNEDDNTEILGCKKIKIGETLMRYFSYSYIYADRLKFERYCKEYPREFDGLYSIRYVMESLSKWLSEFGVAKELKIKELNLRDEKEFVREKYYSIYIIDDNNNEVNIRSSGYGVSKILRMLIKIFTTSGFFMIEEPEANIHPTMQRKLADLFVEEAKSERKFILETHSEHLVRGLQLAVAQKRIKHSDIAIYYIDKNEKCQIKRMEMDELGEFYEEWPNEFYSAGDVLAFELFKAQNSKN
ncbi:MAG: hypothetical protein FJ216_11245 [Ignavibacteria bacterium]|nr:hypothetical protein [Ignavibacteria bacterium]